MQKQDSRTLSGKVALFNKIALILLGLAMSIAFYLHLRAVKTVFFVDLRNRVVGARLMNEGIAPYFFKWNPSYPVTLLDPLDKCTISNNMTTSPPSVLLLMQPLARLPYKTICAIWIITHYLFFVLTFALFYRFFKDPWPRLVLTVTAIVILFTGFWGQSVIKGQSHFLLPAFLAGILLLSKSHYRFSFALIGLLFALAVWIRPNALVMFPFFLLSQQTKKWQLVAGCAIGGLLLTALTFALHHQYLWIDFYHSCKEWARNYAKPSSEMIDCWRKQPVEVPRGSRAYYIFHRDGEIFNVPLFIERLTGLKVSHTYLLLLSLIAWLIGLWAYFKKRSTYFAEAVFTGLWFYWLFEISAPLGKMTYYYVELVIVLYYLGGKFNQLIKVEKVGLGLALLVLYLDFLPVNMILSEIILMSCLGFHQVRTWLHTPAKPSHDSPVPY